MDLFWGEAMYTSGNEYVLSDSGRTWHLSDGGMDRMENGLGL